MKNIIKNLLKEYFDDEYDFDYPIPDNPKPTKQAADPNFKNLLKDLNATKTEGKTNTFTFDQGNAKIFFKKTPQAKTVELDLITTDPNHRGQGHAKAALAKFLSVIDKYRYKVELMVVPRDTTTDTSKLMKFYSNHGFRKISDFEMVR
jgi:GNAT superfamily N-acetyltransferase